MTTAVFSIGEKNVPFLTQLVFFLKVTSYLDVGRCLGKLASPQVPQDSTQ